MNYNNNRIILRNFGHWLGMITVSSNIPILHEELDLAGLLLYAYTSGQQELLYIAPFVAEVVMAATRSCVCFKNWALYNLSKLNI